MASCPFCGACPNWVRVACTSLTVTIPVGSQSRHPHFTHDSPLPFSLQAHCDPPPRLCTLVCAGLLPGCPPNPSTPYSVDPSPWTWLAQSLCWPQSAEGKVATSGYMRSVCPFQPPPRDCLPRIRSGGWEMVFARRHSLSAQKTGRHPNACQQGTTECLAGRVTLWTLCRPAAATRTGALPTLS